MIYSMYYIPEPSKELNILLVVWPRSNCRKTLVTGKNARATPGTSEKSRFTSLRRFCHLFALVVRTFLGSPNLQSVMAQRGDMKKRSFCDTCSFLKISLE